MPLGRKRNLRETFPLDRSSAVVRSTRPQSPPSPAERPQPTDRPWAKMSALSAGWRWRHSRVEQLQLLSPFFGLLLAGLLLHEPVPQAMVAVIAWLCSVWRVLGGSHRVYIHRTDAGTRYSARPLDTPSACHRGGRFQRLASALQGCDLRRRERGGQRGKLSRRAVNTRSHHPCNTVKVAGVFEWVRVEHHEVSVSTHLHRPHRVRPT